ncbi:traB domain-containing protein isoform X2 [Phymastichus coffea]|nr:traB domain-containing protein isoform X2 [Phymastichus coffea]
MEDKNFFYEAPKKELKIATTDFINNETGINSVTIDIPIPEPVKLGPSTENYGSTRKSEHHEQKNHKTSDSTAVIVDNIDNSKNINSREHYDIKENNSNTHPSSDMSIIKEPDSNIDNNLPETVTLLRTPDGGKCYLVGTAHFSVESQNDVAKIIQAVQPHTVLVELCLSRIHVLQLDEETILQEAKNLTLSKMMDVIKTNGIYKGMFFVLFLSMSAHLTKVLGLAPGGEFRTAFKEAKKIPNCIVHLGDRPIQITIARALRSLTWWQSIKLTWNLLREKDTITLKDVEKYKSRDTIEGMMAELAGEYPALKEVFVKERDLFLTHSLQQVCRTRIGPNGEAIPTRAVGVVGIGHTFGIIENWGKVERKQIVPIMSIPPPSLSSKVLKFTGKATLIGAVIYIGYRFIPMSTNLLATLKSSVEGLIEVSIRK